MRSFRYSRSRQIMFVWAIIILLILGGFVAMLGLSTLEYMAEAPSDAYRSSGMKRAAGRGGLFSILLVVAGVSLAGSAAKPAQSLWNSRNACVDLDEHGVIYCGLKDSGHADWRKIKRAAVCTVTGALEIKLADGSQVVIPKEFEQWDELVQSVVERNSKPTVPRY